MSVELRFDQSLQEKSSGACFKIIARDLTHAQQIIKWLQTKCPDLTGVSITKTVAYEDWLSTEKDFK